MGTLVVVDLVLGALAIGLLPLRRRYPVTIAAVTAAFSAVSATSLAAAIWAAISMSTQRRWFSVTVVGGLWIVATILYELVVRASIATVYPSPWASGALAIAIYAICVATGFYIGARRALLVSLRERAENAEREQALRAEAAREAERTRIAREMHDVLAHRISLVALHAGALTYRTDLTRQETADAAGIIQSNAQLALTELRQVLGVLRGGPPPDRPEPAQPTLANLPALLADAREAGMTVAVEATDAPDLSPTVSRTAYRVVQEALTNARRHAPGQPVFLRLTHTDALVQIEVRNPTPAWPATDRRSAQGAAGVGAGVGLIGLRERAELAGGRLEHGHEPRGDYLLRIWLPWV